MPKPNQVGFSYDVPTNGSLNLVNDTTYIPPESRPGTLPPQVFLNGTFPSQNPNNTANTTATAALAVWHLMQGFLTTFPQYQPPNNSALGVNLFAESYGGHYGPVFAETWEAENARRMADGNIASNSTVDIRLAALGIVNGCVDDLVQGPYYPAMMVNNTYNLELLSPVQASLANGTFYQAGGCQDLIGQCRTAAEVSDPENVGDVAAVNALCESAATACESAMLGPYEASGRSYYDLAHLLPESFPPSTYIDYLNTAAVQLAVGAAVNFTETSGAVYSAFTATGDHERGPLVPQIAALLNKGVRVGLVYGDRDFICNWLGGEAVSLSVASEAGGAYAAQFPSAGYAPIIVNDSYIGGVVREFGNLSFSRIYQAGHFVPAYQPETAFQVFARIIMGTSVSTGQLVSLGSYNTTGPLNATATMVLPDSPSATCYLRAIESSCAQDQQQALLEGEGVVINGVWYSASSDWPGVTMTTSSPAASASSTTTTTQTLTGLFTATSTPKSNGGLRFAARRSAPWLAGATMAMSLL